MEKINDIIFKTPSLSGIITFLCAFTLTIILKLCFGFKTMGLEQVLVPMALTFSYLYGYKIKKPMPKQYKLKYSLSVTIPYLLFGTLIILYAPKFAHFKHFDLLFIGILIPFIMMTFATYFLSGFTSKKSSNLDYQKQLDAQKNLPIEIQNKRRFVSWILVIFMALPLIYSNLCDRQIVNVDSNTTLSLTIIFLIGLFIIIKYLYDTKVK